MFCKRYLSLDARILAVCLSAVSANEQRDKTVIADAPHINGDSSAGVGNPRRRNVGIAIQRCTKMVRKKMTEIGTPGMVIGVSLNGENVWTRGFGCADIENSVPCKPETVMRIASISKCITMAAVAKLMENGLLDMDLPVQKYVPEFPEKSHGNKQVKITTRMLLIHTSGLRHYQKKDEKEKKLKGVEMDKNTNSQPELENAEFHSTKHYKSVLEALDIFKDDLLLHRPGKKFLYSTHAWTLISAVVEKVAGEEFELHMKKLFYQLGMDSTFAEHANDIVYHRAKHYKRNTKGRLVNVPYVDNSNKWAGGGFLSNVPDLLKFGNVMLYSFQYSENLYPKQLPGFLKLESVKNMWRPQVTHEEKEGKIPDNETYGLGWYVYPEVNEFGCAKQRDFEVAHTGGAVGGSSILYICPMNAKNTCDTLPKGVVIAIITNLQAVNLTDLARKINEEFKKIV